MRPIPAGQVRGQDDRAARATVLQKEEDKNVDFGDTYVPQQFWLSGYPLGDAASVRPHDDSLPP